jgi:thiol-disulfide isomerase/thioredoxin
VCKDKNKLRIKSKELRKKAMAADNYSLFPFPFSLFCVNLQRNHRNKMLMSTQMNQQIAEYFKTQPVVKAWLFGSFAQKIILSIILAAAGCIQMFSQNPSALPVWERKSAPAVILGRYVNYHIGDDANPPGFNGNKESLKGGSLPPVTKDTINGTFTITWDICYPLMHTFFDGMSILLFPGDTVRLDIDRTALNTFDTYKRKSHRDSITTQKLRELWSKAVHMEGATFELPQLIKMKGIKLGYSREYATAHYRDTFDEWREVCWNEFKEVVKQLDSLDLTAQGREYQRMVIEQDYLKKLRDYAFTKKIHNLTKDKDSLEMFQQQFTFKDPHAPELTYYRNVLGFFACQNNLFDEGRKYILANGLEASPLGQWFKELDNAKNVMTRIKAGRAVTEDELNALSSEFKAQIREVQAVLRKENADRKGTWCDLPEGEPQEWLSKIVAGHKGRNVFIDFWATWCGPCVKGMREMESVKDSLTARGFDFVYITDTSSNSNEWTKYIANHAGDHYIVPKDKMTAMQIPDYENAIPHYLIYDREGKFIKAISGWDSVEVMMQELEKVE